MHDVRGERLRAMMNRGYALVILTLLPAFAARGGELGAPSAAPLSPGLVIKLPGTTSEALERAFLPESSPVSPESSAARVTMAATDARILEPLRQMLIPALRTGDTSGLRLCHPSGPRFSELLRQAANSLEFFDLEDARLALTRAQKAFTCGVEVASQEDLGQLVLLAGILQIYQGRDDDGRFEDALSVAPMLPSPTQHSDEVKKQFNRARKQRSRLAKVEVQRWSGDKLNLKVLLDGGEYTDAIESLSVGTHFLQLVKPDGQALAGVIINLEPSAVGERLILPPVQLRPPGAAEVVGTLESEVRQGRPGAPVIDALESLRLLGDYAWVVLVDFEPGTRRTRATWLFPDGLVETRTIDAPTGYASSRDDILEASVVANRAQPAEHPERGSQVSRARQDDATKATSTADIEPATPESTESIIGNAHRRKRRLGVVVTSMFTAGAVVSGVLYWDAYSRLNTETFGTDEAAQDVWRRGLIAGASTIGCLTGALISGGITLLMPPSPSRSSAMAGVNPHVSLLAGTNALEFRLGGTW